MSDRIRRVRTLYEGWLNLRLLDIRLGAGEVVERTIVDHPQGALVLLYHEGRRTALLVSEIRPAVEFAGEPPLLELVGGKVDDGDPEACARREAVEEAGVRIRDIEPIGRFWTTPASSTERIDLFLAAYWDEDRIGAGGGLASDSEHIDIHEVGLAELWQRIEQGLIGDSRVFMTLQALRLRRPDLFDLLPAGPGR